MKTTFSYFPGMFENPAPAKIIKKKNKIKISDKKIDIKKHPIKITPCNYFDFRKSKMGRMIIRANLNAPDYQISSETVRNHS